MEPMSYVIAIWIFDMSLLSICVLALLDVGTAHSFHLLFHESDEVP